MLTKVILEGAMGKKFGRVWHLNINTPMDAIRLINANIPGFIQWMRSNLSEYSAYQVICTSRDGVTENLSQDSLNLQNNPKVIRFVPVLAGAGGNAGRDILGVVLIVAAFYFGPEVMGGTGAIDGGTAMSIGALGASLIMSGIASSLSPTPSPSATSYYFNGPSNTVGQGSPVPLVYGRLKVGSSNISLSMNVTQLTPVQVG